MSNFVAAVSSAQLAASQVLVEKSVGDLWEEIRGLALAWRVASLPWERRETEASSQAPEGILAAGFFGNAWWCREEDHCQGVPAVWRRAGALASAKAYIQSQLHQSQSVPPPEAALCSLRITDSHTSLFWVPRDCST